jgi:hypothetical protein
MISWHPLVIGRGKLTQLSSRGSCFVISDMLIVAIRVIVPRGVPEGADVKALAYDRLHDGASLDLCAVLKVAVASSDAVDGKRVEYQCICGLGKVFWVRWPHF